MCFRDRVSVVSFQIVAPRGGVLLLDLFHNVSGSVCFFKFYSVSLPGYYRAYCSHPDLRRLG